MPKTRMFVQQYKSVGFVDAGACEGADIILAKRRDEITAKAVPTAEMARIAERALKWRDEYGRGGTAIGVARARDISNRSDLSAETLGRMVSFFARHESTSKGAEGFREGEPGFPSAGRIAWDLWGGDAGAEWASREFDRIRAEKIAEIEQLTKAGRRMAGARLTKLREYVAGLHALLSEVDDESTDSGGGKDTSMSKQFDPSALPQDAQDHIAGVEKAANDRIEAAEKKAEETAAKLAELEAKHADPEDAFKGLSDVVRKRIEDAEKAAKEAQDAAKAERDARVSAEFIAKAKAYEGKLPVKASEFGLVLKRLAEREQTDADIAEVERVLKAAAEVSKLTAVIGEDGDAEADPAAKIRAAADEIRKANPTLTVAQARVQARKQNPELAKAEREAERAAA